MDLGKSHTTLTWVQSSWYVTTTLCLRPRLTIEQTDYTHTDYLGYLLRVYDIPPTFLPIENNLINGKNDYDCGLEEQGRACQPDAPLSQFEFKPGKKHLLRLINAGGSSNQKFSIDGHKLTVVANDFVQVKPYEVDVVTLGVGQRSDVIVTAAKNSTEAVWMRSELDVPCQNGTVHRPLARAVVRYTGASPSILPNTTGHAWESVDCLNVRLIYLYTQVKLLITSI